MESTATQYIKKKNRKSFLNMPTVPIENITPNLYVLCNFYNLK